MKEGGGWREGIVREFVMDMYALLYLKWITNKDLLYSTQNSAHYSVEAWREGNLGEGGYMSKYESLPCSPETITTLLIGYTPIQNKKLEE